MSSVARATVYVLLLAGASLLLHGCGLETGSDEGAGNSTNPAEPGLDPDTSANLLRLQGLLPGTTLTLQRSGQPGSTLTLDQDGVVNLTGTALEGVTVGTLTLLPTNTQANQGTHRIQQCSPETDPDDTARLRIRCREFLFFIAGNAMTHELWGTDGTPSGTQRLAIPGNDKINSQIRYPSVQGNALYFSARDEAHGQELWRSDGTPQGTRLLADINPNNDDPDIDRKGSNPSGANLGDFSVAGDWLFFSAREAAGATGGGVWAANGQTIRKLPYSGGLTRARAMDGDLYLLTPTDPMDFDSNIELWKIDGITTDAKKLLDIGRKFPTDSNYLSYYDNLMVSDKRLYFTRRNTTDYSRELWYLEKDQAPVKVLEIENWIHQYFNDTDLHITRFGTVDPIFLDGITYFSVELRRKSSVIAFIFDQETGNVLPLDTTGISGNRYRAKQSITQFWRTDGTAQGTRLITSLSPRTDVFHDTLLASNPPVKDGKIYLNGTHAASPFGYDDESWRNASAGIYLYDPVTDKAELSQTGLQLASWGPQIGSKIFLRARSKENAAMNLYETDLYVTDGTAEGTQIIRRRGTYPDTYYTLDQLKITPATIIDVVNGLVLIRTSFRADGDTAAVMTYWVTDGTPDSTIRVK